jgi:hypothetical protein
LPEEPELVWAEVNRNMGRLLALAGTRDVNSE